MPTFSATNFTLENGAILRELDVAYDLLGELNAARSNAILVFHGATSTHHGADEPTLDRRRGWWHEIIGPGKLFDTDRYCIVSSNTLGSCYGTTGPASTDPATGKRYGAAFPRFTYADIVQAQNLLLKSLGIDRLVAVAGASIGGFQAFQWAVSHPGFAAAVIALDTGPWDTMNMARYVPDLVATFAADPAWNDGNYHSGADMVEALTTLRIATLQSYGIHEKLALTHRAEDIEPIISKTAREWAEEFDAHALIGLMKTWAAFDLRDQLHRIRARVLYILCDTDELFPASVGDEVMKTLRVNDIDAQFHEIKSTLGHYATAEEPEKWVPVARAFLEQLEAC